MPPKAVCKKELARSTVTYLECPRCGSTDIDCDVSSVVHEHHCNDCGLHDDDVG